MKRHIAAVTVLSLSAATGVATWLSIREATASAPVAPKAPPAAVNAKTAGPAERPSSEALVARGAHLVMTSACNDCHTPFKLGPNGPEPDMSRMLSGHPEAMKVPPPPPASGPWIGHIAATNTAWAGPWGVSFTANLTPDKDTGLGTWTKETFKQAIRTGRHMGRGRPILPPMPYPMYKNFTDDEFEAIFAYLQSIPAIKNRVPDPLPPAAAKPSKR